MKKKRKGRPKLAGEDAPAGTIMVRCRKKFVARLNRWRKDQKDSLGKAEAVRRLAETALDEAGY